MNRNAEARTPDADPLMRAADWVQRVNCADASDRDVQEWLKWCEESADNRRAFEHIQSLHQGLREMPIDYRDELRAEFSRSARARSGMRGLALAASLALMVTAGLLWDWFGKPAVDISAIHATARGEHRSITLSDGSKILLGGASTVEVKYGPRQRLLYVQDGEAYFEVRRDPVRPFIVQAGALRVTAMGTAFNIEKGNHRITVAVTEGSVNVVRTAPATGAVGKGSQDGAAVEPMHLSVGQRVVVPLSQQQSLRSEPAAVDTIDPVSAVAWQSGQLQFAGEPLRVVIDSVNRYSRQPVAIGDVALGNLQYTGTVLRERVEEWIENLPQIFPLRTVSLQDGTVVLLAR